MFCMMTAHADIVNDGVFLPICCFRTQLCLIECPSIPCFSELVRSWYGDGTELIRRRPMENIPNYPKWGNWGIGKFSFFAYRPIRH